MLKTLPLFAAALGLAAATAQARPVDVYDCSFNTNRPFMSEKVIMTHDIESDEVMVMDGMINFVEGEPIEARISQNDNDRFTASWRVVFRDSSGTTARLDYRMAFIKRNSNSVYSMSAGQYENRESARGRCTVSRQDF